VERHVNNDNIYGCDDAVATSERESDVGDAVAAAADQSHDIVNGSAVRDTYIDTLNLWVCITP